MQNLTSVSIALQALHAAKLENRSASVMVTLRSDETLTAMVSLRSVDQLRIDGGGHKLYLSDFGLVVNGGQLCLHDVELTGGRNVPALVVLDATANVNTSHTRISYCTTRIGLTEIGRDAASALDVCTGAKSFFDTIPAAAMSLACPKLPEPFQQCCDPSKRPTTKANPILVSNLATGMLPGLLSCLGHGPIPR
jgi:hypothetical protein